MGQVPYKIKLVFLVAYLLLLFIYLMDNKSQVPAVAGPAREESDYMLNPAHTLRQEVCTELNPEGAGSKGEEGEVG